MSRAISASCSEVVSTSRSRWMRGCVSTGDSLRCNPSARPEPSAWCRVLQFSRGKACRDRSGGHDPWPGPRYAGRVRRPAAPFPKPETATRKATATASIPRRAFTTPRLQAIGTAARRPSRPWRPSDSAGPGPEALLTAGTMPRAARQLCGRNHTEHRYVAPLAPPHHPDDHGGARCSRGSGYLRCLGSATPVARMSANQAR